MGFAAPSSTYLDELARRKAAQEAMARMTGQAAGQATAALGAEGAREQRVKEEGERQAQLGAENARAAALDAANAEQRNVANEQAKANYRLQMENQRETGRQHFAEAERERNRLQVEAARHGEERSDLANRLRVEGERYEQERADRADVEAARFNLEQQRLEQDAAAKAAALAERAREHSGPGKNPNGKPLSPADLANQITTPRRIVESLGDLETEIPNADTGIRKGFEDVAVNVPIVGGAIKNAIQSRGQAEFESKVDVALAAVNNAMDRRVTDRTMALWKGRLVDAAKQGPDAYALAIDGIKQEVDAMQTDREANLKASGYLVPPRAGGFVLMTNGSETRRVPSRHVDAARADGYREVR